MRIGGRLGTSTRLSGAPGMSAASHRGGTSVPGCGYSLGNHVRIAEPSAAAVDTVSPVVSEVVGQPGGSPCRVPAPARGVVRPSVRIIRINVLPVSYDPEAPVCRGKRTVERDGFLVIRLRRIPVGAAEGLLASKERPERGQ